MHIDETYLRILDVLQREARIPFTELADRVDRAESTVRDRVGALEHAGVLQGYRAVVDLREIGYGARGRVRADVDREALPEVSDRLASLPEVVHGTLSTGAKPLTVELVAQDLHALEHTVERDLSSLPLANTELDVVLRDVVPRRPRDLSRRYDGPLPLRSEDQATYRS